MTLPSSYSLLKFVYLTGQWHHSLEVHSLLRKILDLPLQSLTDFLQLTIKTSLLCGIYHTNKVKYMFFTWTWLLFSHTAYTLHFKPESFLLQLRILHNKMARVLLNEDITTVVFSLIFYVCTCDKELNNSCDNQQVNFFSSSKESSLHLHASSIDCHL